MKNCPGTPGSRSPRSSRSSVYGPTRSEPVTLCLTGRAPSSASIRSWRETACSARAVAIACTAAAAPESVVMHGTRFASAASRIA